MSGQLLLLLQHHYLEVRVSPGDLLGCAEANYASPHHSEVIVSTSD